VQVEDIDQDLFAAINHATDRASRSVARALEREAPIVRG
jgi:ribosome-associated translation inhibitor RaiA